MNMKEKFEFIRGNKNGGIIYLIKDGEIIAFPIEKRNNMNSNEKDKMGKLFNSSQDENENTEFLIKDEVFKDLLNNGYTIIRCFNPTKTVQLLIGTEITEEDYFAIMRIIIAIFKEYVTGDENFNFEIYNRINIKGLYETETVQFLMPEVPETPELPERLKTNKIPKANKIPEEKKILI